MRTRLLASALLALVGATSTLAAQTRTPRPAPERDEPRTMARTLLSRIAGDPDRATLGVTIVSGGAADTLGILVDDVTEGGPAEKAGIRKGDRLVSINGVNLRLNPADAGDADLQGLTQRRLTRELSRHTAGDDVELRLLREGKPMTLTVKTVAAESLAPRGMTFVGGRRANPDRASLGIGLGSTGSRRDTLGILVASLATDGPAEKAGLEEGDRIASINGVDLRVAREDVGDWGATNARVRRLTRELDKVKAGDEVELRVYRAGQPRTLKVRTAAARDVERGARQMFIIGDNAGMGDFDFFGVPPVPPTPPVPPGAPVPPVAPNAPVPPLPPSPPAAPRFYWFDGDDDGVMRLRVSPRMRVEMRERTRDALERALELAPRALEFAPRSRERIRVEMDDDGDVREGDTSVLRERSSRTTSSRARVAVYRSA